MTTLQKILTSRTKVRFHDCDPFNHLNNSRYIDYIVAARGDQLIEAYGFDIYALARTEGLGWVAAQTQISYLAPALLMEEVLIETRLIGCSDRSLLMEGLMWNAGRTRLKAVMWAKLVHFDLKTQRSIPHSTQLMQLFDDILHPLEGSPGFEQRVQELRSGSGFGDA